VPHGPPAPVRPDEPAEVAAAAAELNLAYVVVTSVTRDDLTDGGAAHFAATVQAVRERLPTAGIEVLTPDFGGAAAAIARVLAARPTVFNHNLETCARLTPAIRSGADYARSLTVLGTAAAQSDGAGGVGIKSGFMLGLGETERDVHDMLGDLRRHGVAAVTIGQYLAPSPDHWPVARFVPPEEFAEWGRIARDRYGFVHVASAPLVRSSYRAEAWGPAP
jgi:lipoic acid synthetase